MDLLENAWNSAKPRLTAIRSSIDLSKPVEQRILRVGQIDAELLDQELAQILQEPITKALSLVDDVRRSLIEPELALALQLLLYKLSVWDNGGSYGARLQGLRYVVPPSNVHRLTPSGLPQEILLLHASLTVFVPYLHSRLRVHALSRAWPDAPSSDRRRRAWSILTSTESLHTFLGLVNFVVFLWNGRYRTLADRLLHMRLVPSRGRVERDVSYEFMNRQMVWHAFTEFLLFLLPLLHTRSVRQGIRRLLSCASPSRILSLIPASAARRLGLANSLQSSGSTIKKRGKYWALPPNECAICAEKSSLNLITHEPPSMFSNLAPQSTPSETAENEPIAHPINVPYVASCGDIYCYSCIAEHLMRTADDLDKQHGWECLRCGGEITSANRSDISLGATDISGSMGSYSESGLPDHQSVYHIPFES
ncbi:hypothetical protein Agabi119p4_4426 [Agaricus bisporus var. burnettii]|uniref:RING-type E3 ubiquitin transferase (cysteine targeting) n=1 Tax=Agaricus bisporus var. burnettii TaxID=192524 RepID=A0A8H7F3F1_AGABI|nr:hypothetical protein Agabi119p4_4426 [Agaricus bisporus var. burnettii]